MEIIFKAIIVLIIGYVIGSLNTSIIVSKFYGTDIREHGSKNAGMTNTFRVLGKFAGLLVILGDTFKGILSAYLGKLVLGQINGVSEVGMLLGGLGAILGHNFPIFFRFKGGKGILTTAAVLTYIDYRIAASLFLIFLVVVITTRYISLGSIVCAVLIPFAVTIYRHDNARLYMIVWSIIVAISAIIMHRENIKRLFSGTESKFSIKKKS
ncbi:MAG: glycerol-3-phosphate 1-O-acyltransferase PlsY [Clostridiales bacterium]|nr:glycerol-3-phosphate 1-O-acyltransferase PlsY [Clostridiales bacterium]